MYAGMRNYSFNKSFIVLMINILFNIFKEQNNSIFITDRTFMIEKKNLITSLSNFLQY